MTALAPRSKASVTWLATLAATPALLSGPHGDLVLARIAEHDGARRRRQTLGERIVDLAMHENALRRRADLAGIDEAARCCRGRGAVEIGVVEDHDRSVAAELHQLRLAGGAQADLLAGRGTSGEADGVGTRIGDDLVADDRARTGDEIENAWRKVGLVDGVRQRDATSEVVGAGVQTMVLPAASPGAMYSTGMFTGKFHGVTTA